MDHVDIQGLGNGHDDGDQDVKGAGVVHDTACAQEYNVDDEQHDVLVVRKGQGHFRKGCGDSLLGQHPGENACVHNNQQNHACCLGG